MSDYLPRPWNPRLYVARGRYSGLIKIGISERIEQRMKTLKADLLFTLDHDRHARSLERDLHSRFSPYREHGEWFLNEGELASFISMHCDSPVD
jgi:hypothetical protein